MIKKRKYDRTGRRRAGLFEIWCDVCQKKLEQFIMGTELCEKCRWLRGRKRR